MSDWSVIVNVLSQHAISAPMATETLLPFTSVTPVWAEPSILTMALLDMELDVVSVSVWEPLAVSQDQLVMLFA